MRSDQRQNPWPLMMVMAFLFMASVIAPHGPGRRRADRDRASSKSGAVAQRSSRVRPSRKNLAKAQVKRPNVVSESPGDKAKVAKTSTTTQASKPERLAITLAGKSIFYSSRMPGCEEFANVAGAPPVEPMSAALDFDDVCDHHEDYFGPAPLRTTETSMPSGWLGSFASYCLEQCRENGVWTQARERIWDLAMSGPAPTAPSNATASWAACYPCIAREASPCTAPAIPSAIQPRDDGAERTPGLATYPFGDPFEIHRLIPCYGIESPRPVLAPPVAITPPERPADPASAPRSLRPWSSPWGLWLTDMVPFLAVGQSSEAPPSANQAPVDPATADPSTDLDSASEEPASDESSSNDSPATDEPSGRNPKPPPPSASILEGPQALLGRLNRLMCECEVHDWATRSADAIQKLIALSPADSANSSAILADLEALADESCPLLASLPDGPAAIEAHRARHSLARRISLWRLQISAQSGFETNWANTLGPGLAPYLSIEPITPNAGASLSSKRFEAPELALGQLAVELEKFESTGLPSHARRVALAAAKISANSPMDGPKTQAWLEQNYRNANLRVSFSPEFANRFLPHSAIEQGQIRERVLGVPTTGASTTDTALALRFLPDTAGWRFELAAKGAVRARTWSLQWPAALASRSRATFDARKEFRLSPSGLDLTPAVSSAQNASRLTRVRTEFEALPIIGPVLDSFVRMQYDESRSRASREAESKIERKAQRRLDEEFERQSKRGMQRLDKVVVTPLKRLELAPQILEMQSTPDRVSARCRLASLEQLGAHTPRPKAPADCWASLQIHQSAVNNSIEALGLDGREFTIPELHALLVDRLGFQIPAPESARKDVRFKFAKRNAVRVQFREDRMELTLALAELRTKDQKWRRFQVTVSYRPDYKAREPRLIRGETIELAGSGVAGQPQILLRGVFSRMFPADGEIDLSGGAFARDPRLASLRMTQFDCVDGWIGLAIGR